MLAYAASSRSVAGRRSNPNIMLIIIGAHVAGVALLMSAKMDLPIRPTFNGTEVTFVPITPDPPPIPIKPRVPQPPQPTHSIIDQPPTSVDLGPVTGQRVDTGPPPTDLGPIAGGGTAVIPHVEPILPPNPVKSGPRLLTSGADLKPPYPASKLLNEEEGAVTVRLTIDETGHVIAVEPVGRADPAFLASARKHLIARWRFKPASEDGHAVASTTTVTLHFELDG